MSFEALMPRRLIASECRLAELLSRLSRRLASCRRRARRLRYGVYGHFGADFQMPHMPRLDVFQGAGITRPAGQQALDRLLLR